MQGTFGAIQDGYEREKLSSRTGGPTAEPWKWCSGQRGSRWGRIGGRLEQKFRARNYPNRGRWLPHDGKRARTDSAVGSAVADDLEPAYGASRDASRADRGLQPAARHTAAPLEMAADDSG